MLADHLLMKISFFDQQLNTEILNYIKKENINNEEKKNTLHTFIGYVLSLVINAKKMVKIITRKT